MRQLLPTALILLALALVAQVLPEPALAQRAPTEITGGITGTAYLKTDVLVRPLDVLSGGRASAAAGDVIDRVLAGDLVYSGLCRVGDGTRPAPAGQDSFRFDWTIEGIVEGPLLDAAQSGEEVPLTVDFNLLTYPGRQLVMNKRYRPFKDQYRTTAHHFANEVLAMITGEPGICLTRIVFSRGTGDRRDLYVVDYDGEGLLRVTANRTLNLCPDWSPDNAQIAFTSYRGGQQGLFSLDTATGQVRQIIAQEGLNLGADWRPDGKELLVSLSGSGDPEIYRIDPVGNIVKRLTVSSAIEVSPNWAPGGRELVFTSDRTGTPQLYIIDDSGVGGRRLTFEGQYNDSAVWSPNGDRIAYANRERDVTRIVLVKPTGEDRRVVTGDHWGNCEDPSWAPDGRHLVFASDRTGVFKLYVYDAVDESFRQLTFGDDPDITPAWSH